MVLSVPPDHARGKSGVTWGGGSRFVLTRLEMFRVSRGIKSADLADESGYHRSHVLRIRQATIEPSRDAIAAIVSALRRLSLEDVRAEMVFELMVEESGPWRRDRVERFASEVAAFRKQREHAQRLLIEVSRAPRPERLERLRRIPDGMSAAVARAATLEGHRLIDRKPAHSEALLALGAAVADEAPDLSHEYRAFLSGRARLERAGALRQLGSYADALPLLDEAEHRFEGVPSCTHELGRAWFTRGAILFKMNGLDEALRYVRLSINIFAALDDHRRIGRARFVEGNILFEEGRIEEARTLWLSIAPIFEAGRDRHTLASLWMNLGWCEIERGEPESARAWLHRARERFTYLHSAADLARTRWALSLAEARFGDREAGIRSLLREQTELDALGMTTEAGMAALDVTEILLLDPANSRKAARICRDLVPLFERAGAKKEVLKALAYLWEAATAGAANADLVRRVRADVRRAERDSTYTFDVQVMG